MAETTAEPDEGDYDIDRPDWLPEEYDPEAPLHERIPIIAELDGGVELHVSDDRVTEVVGRPKELSENHAGTYTLKAGHRSDEHLWDWEIVVPEDSPARLVDVDPEQSMEAYQKTKSTYMDDIDVRVWGVDAEMWLERDEVEA